MSTPNRSTDTVRGIVMKTKDRTRWVVLAASLSVLAAAAGIWIVAQGRSAQEARQDQSTNGTAAETDPYAGHDMVGSTTGDGAVHLDPRMASALGVTVVAAELAPLSRTIRTTGHVAFDETRLTTVSPKYAGFVERLYVDFTGQAVRSGQPLLEIYSPELVAAQEELLAALRLENQLGGSVAPATRERTASLVDAARRRLLLWDVSPAQVRQIEQSGQLRRTLTLHAPFGGFVTEKMVQAGQTVEMGMPLYRLADLSRVWVEADVYEQDLRFVRLGEIVQVELAAYPDESFHGRISYIYPEVRVETRSTRVRVELANPGGRVKPGMYATVEIEAPISESALMVPRDAVMHSGTHAMVFVEEAVGLYRAREVSVGIDVGGQTQIISGLLAGERVVQRANFLLDSESRLMENVGAMPGMNH
jgi:membrane fusion protein, copper/silver efflux system